MKPMTPKQQMNVLYWVEALLSDQYKHGKHKMYDPKTGCYCAIGVALLTQFVPQMSNGEFKDLKEYGWNSTQRWFEATFGLPRNATLYSTMNDMSTNYLTVVALLLHAVPASTTILAFRKDNLQHKFMEQVDALNQAR